MALSKHFRNLIKIAQATITKHKAHAYNKHLSTATQHMDSKYKDHDARCATKHVDMIMSLGTRWFLI
jgi:hypothetical protein